MRDEIGVECVWTVKERRSGIWVPVLRRKNTFTSFGLTALASAIGGSYLPPTYLVIDGYLGTLPLSYAAGVSTLHVSPTIPNFANANGSSWIIGLGLATQETIVTSTVGSIILNLAASTVTANLHNAGEYVLYTGALSDTLASSIGAEAAYDSLNFPNQRPIMMSGYSAGAGNYTLQFLITAPQAPIYIAGCGLADSLYLGAGNLHNHVMLGYDHTAGTLDIEIDANLTLINT